MEISIYEYWHENCEYMVHVKLNWIRQLNSTQRLLLSNAMALRAFKYIKRFFLPFKISNGIRLLWTIVTRDKKIIGKNSIQFNSKNESQMMMFQKRLRKCVMTNIIWWNLYFQHFEWRLYFFVKLQRGKSKVNKKKIKIYIFSIANCSTGVSCCETILIFNDCQ